MSSAFIIDSDFLFGTNVRTGFGAHRRLTFLLRTSGFEDLPLSPTKPIPQHGVRERRRDVVGIWSLAGRLPREALAHRNHPGRTGGFSPRARRAFLSRETDHRLDLQKTRRLLRRDDGFA